MARRGPRKGEGQGRAATGEGTAAAWRAHVEIVEARIPQGSPCKGVNRHAGRLVREAQGIEADVALEHPCEDLPLPRGRLPEMEGACDVGRAAAILRARVEKAHLAAVDDADHLRRSSERVVCGPRHGTRESKGGAASRVRAKDVPSMYYRAEQSIAPESARAH